MGSCICFIVIIGFILFFSISSRANERFEVKDYYESYQIKQGDTLWNIADKYISPDFKDKETYIREIKRINHMLDDSIVEGDYIIVVSCKPEINE